MKRLCALILALVMAVMVLPAVPAQAAPGTVTLGSFKATELSQYHSLRRQNDGAWVADTKSEELALLDEEFRVLFTVDAFLMRYICPGRYWVSTGGFSDLYSEGIVDRQGKQIIPCQYSGLEWNEENKCFYGADKNGTVIFNADGSVRFHCGIYSEPFTYASKLMCKYKDTNGMVGLKDLNGNVVLKAIYDDIFAVGGDIVGSLERCDDPLGRFFVKKNGVWGMVDRNGAVLITPQFDEIWGVDFARENGPFFIKVEKNGGYGLYFSDGRKLLDCVYSEHSYMDFNVRDDTVVFKMENGSGTAFHFDRDTGDLIRTVEPGEQYLSDDRYVEVDSAGREWLVDGSGRRVSSCGYGSITDLSILDGQCRYVQIQSNGAAGLLDIVTGKEVVPLSTDLINAELDQVVEGRILLCGRGEWGIGFGSYDPVTDSMVYDHLYVEFRGGMVWNTYRHWGVIDRYTGEVIIPCKYASMRYSDGIYYAYAGRMSIFDEDGELLLPPMYPDADMITRDRFAVEDGVGNWGLCDGSGTLLTPQTYDRLRKYGDYDYIFVSRGSGEGLLTMDGEVVIPIEENQELSMESDGWLVVRNQGKFYAINLNEQTPGGAEKPDEGVSGSAVILGRFRGYRLPEGYTIFDIDGAEGADGMVKVRCIDQFGEKYGFADKTGRIVVPCEYDSASNFHEGLALVEKLGQYGYVDTTGKVVIPLIYDAASDFSQGYAAVANGTEAGYIDRTGQPLRLAQTGEVLQCRNAMDFDENGFATVLGLRMNNRSFSAIIDTKGNVVAEPKDSFDYIRSVNGERFILRSDYYWDRLIDSSGNTLFAGEYRVGAVNNPVFDAHNRLFFAENGLAPAQSYATKLWGYVDLDGKIVIDQIYNSVYGFTGDLAKVRKTVNGVNYCGVVDAEGKEIVPVDKAACAVLSCGLIFYRNVGSTYGVLTDRTGKAVYTDYQITEAYSDDYGGRFGYIDQRGVACWAWLDTDGRILGTMEKPSGSIKRLSSELIDVGSSKGYGIVNVFGAEMLPNICSRLYPLEGGGFAASVDGTVYILAEMGAAVSFVDLKGSESYLEAIEFVVSRGIMNGISATELAPEGNLNRAAMVTMLWRLAGKPKGEYKGTFSDVAEGAYYAVPAEWGNANGIVLGYPNGAFGHADVVTREQAATFLYRYVQSCGKGYGANWSYTLTHTDADQIHAYALEAMSWCVQNGVFEPEADGTLNPRGVASRVETAAMFYHVYDLLNN